MRKWIILLVIVLFGSFQTTAFAQDLNGFKYIYVLEPHYNNGGVDIWGIAAKVKKAFSDKGFILVTDAMLKRDDMRENVYALLICKISHTNVIEGVNTVTLTFTDHAGNVVHTSSGDGMALTQQGDFNIATRKALSWLTFLRYKYDPSKTPRPSIPEVEMTDWTEEKVRSYLDSGISLDRIEGIYKSVGSSDLGYYRLGVIKDGYKFKMIILETDRPYWKPGELKAVFEPASLGLYSVTWYMGDKSRVEVFGSMDTRGVLEIDMGTNGKTSKSQFIKVYPLAQESNSPGNTSPRTSPSDIKGKQAVASGTGFVISREGHIATNAHVVNNNHGVTVDVLNSDGSTSRYIADVLLMDSASDVAIIKVNDASFRTFNPLPYSIETRANVGAEVFTIGFPLNTVMGSNYKVANGIISSRTGLNDDVREYQITVPIQPGNSGGPLFNKDGNIVGITTARLNGEAVGTHVENVNYAVKSLYLLNAINSVSGIEDMPEGSSLVGKSMEEQIAVLKNYIVLIKIY